MLLINLSTSSSPRCRSASVRRVHSSTPKSLNRPRQPHQNFLDSLKFLENSKTSQIIENSRNIANIVLFLWSCGIKVFKFQMRVEGWTQQRTKLRKEPPYLVFAIVVISLFLFNYCNIWFSSVYNIDFDDGVYAKTSKITTFVYYPSIKSPFEVCIAICFDYFRITFPPLLRTIGSFAIGISLKWIIFCVAFFCAFFDSCFPSGYFPPFFGVIWNGIAFVFDSVCIASRVAIRVALVRVLDRIGVRGIITWLTFAISVCLIVDIKGGGGGVFGKSKSLGTFASS